MKTLVISPNGRMVTLRLEIRYLEKVDKWFLSIMDAATGASLIQYIPLVSSEEDALNDLLAQFGYKRIGSALVAPHSNEDLGKDPAKDTLDRFGIAWGDGAYE